MKKFSRTSTRYDNIVIYNHALKLKLEKYESRMHISNVVEPDQSLLWYNFLVWKKAF